MHRYISDLHWIMLQCTYLLYTIFIPYMELYNWVNTKNLTSCVSRNDIMQQKFLTSAITLVYKRGFSLEISHYKVFVYYAT